MKKQGLGIRGQQLGICCLFFSAMMGLAAGGQGIQLGEATASHKGHVVLVSDAAEVRAGEPQVVELRFRVDEGFHINSHAPKDELLIPTVLQMDAGGGVKVVGADYQKGSPFRLGGASGEVLDVYQGEFSVSVRVVVPKGASTLSGLLHYQACDNASCFPPKTLPVMVAVTGK